MGISKKLETIYHNGQPDGIRSIRRSLSTMTTYVIPRPLLSEAKNITGINRHGIYYLINESEDNRIAQIYIGQTRNGILRLDDHNRSKDFWNKAIMFLAESKTFTLDMISGLEKYAIIKAQESKRYTVENSVVPKYEIDEYDLATVAQRIGGIYQYHLHGRGKRFERKTLAYLLPRRALHPDRRDFGVDILHTQDILGRVRPGGGVRKREVVLRGECERRRPVAGCFDPPQGSLAGSHFHLRTAVVVEAEDSLRPRGDPVRSIPVLSVVIGIEGKRIVLGAGCRTEDRRKRECRPNLVFHRIVFLSV